VLDNCEHLVDGAAALADLLLRRCPGLTLLATSREALGVEGEVVWPVTGLAHPPIADPSGPAPAPAAGAAAADEALIRAVGAYEAVEFFVERASAVQPTFALTARTAPHVAAITARLDGLPLALELAAAQVGMLGVEQLATRLDDVFAVLTRGRRTALPRHKTLRALLDWSYHLLTPAERALLAQLSVFRGTFTLEHAEAVCAAADPSRDDPGAGALGTGGAPAPRVVAALGRLVEQSLVEVREQEGEARYRLLEPVRQYAAARLAGTPEEVRTRDRHLRWAAALVAAAAPALGEHGRAAVMRLLRQQLEDLRAAVQWATAAPGEARAEARARAALEVVAGLTHFWVSAGRWEDGWRLFEAAWEPARRAGVVVGDGAAAARATDASVVGRALVGGATMALLTGRLDAATTHIASAVAALVANHANPAHGPAERVEAARLLALGHEAAYEVHLSRGDLPAARAALGAGGGRGRGVGRRAHAAARALARRAAAGAHRGPGRRGRHVRRRRRPLARGGGPDPRRGDPAARGRPRPRARRPAGGGRVRARVVDGVRQRVRSLVRLARPRAARGGVRGRRDARARGRAARHARRAAAGRRGGRPRPRRRRAAAGRPRDAPPHPRRQRDPARPGGLRGGVRRGGAARVRRCGRPRRAHGIRDPRVRAGRRHQPGRVSRDVCRTGRRGRR
jgi:predicted ATPase